MSVRFSERMIPLADILLEDQLFRITTDEDKSMEPLAASIAEVGLLSPPILRAVEGGRFQVVSGFRRLTALKILGLTSAACRVVEEGTDRLTCLKLSIADNVSRRSLNPVEQALAVDKISALVQDTGRLCALLSGLGVPISPSLVEKFKALLQLPQPVLTHVARETIPLSVAPLLVPMKEPDARALAEIFATLRLGTNKQREVAVLVREIAAREGTTVSGLLEKDKAIQDIFNGPQTDRGLQAARLRAYLEKRRFPALAQSQEHYRQLEKQLKLGRRARLCPPQHFEGPDFILELTFSDMTEFRRHAALVERLATGDKLETVIAQCGSLDDLSRKKEA
jgi:ParB family chromosome partitioning protein